MAKAPSWAENLLLWYNQHKRQMPWRSMPHPYYTLISEVMLQQTQVDTVIPYFNRFISQFPTVEVLANSELEPILKAWEGLGYYSRARNLHKCAKVICETYNGTVPQSYETLQTLPGIGPYIAAAVSSIAYEAPVPVVDGNVLRVFTRFWGIEDDIKLPATRVDLFKRLTPVIAECQPSVFNQAMMELGALICSPKTPKCTQCPLRIDCYAATHDATSTFPYKSQKAPVPHFHIGVGIIYKGDEVLIAKRKETQMLGGLWEFPGGKQAENESIEETVLREIKEETGLEVKVISKFMQVKHAYTHFKITLHAYKCQWISGTAEAKSADAIKWAKLSDLEQHPFPTANKKLLEGLKSESTTPVLF